jgi:predicted RNase H-like HicB family nuclease
MSIEEVKENITDTLGLYLEDQIVPKCSFKYTKNTGKAL